MCKSSARGKRAVRAAGTGERARGGRGSARRSLRAEAKWCGKGLLCGGCDRGRAAVKIWACDNGSMMAQGVGWRASRPSVTRDRYVSAPLLRTRSLLAAFKRNSARLRERRTCASSTELAADARASSLCIRENLFSHTAHGTPPAHRAGEQPAARMEKRARVERQRFDQARFP